MKLTRSMVISVICYISFTILMILNTDRIKSLIHGHEVLVSALLYVLIGVITIVSSHLYPALSIRNKDYEYEFQAHVLMEDCMKRYKGDKPSVISALNFMKWELKRHDLIALSEAIELEIRKLETDSLKKAS